MTTTNLLKVSDALHTSAWSARALWFLAWFIGVFLMDIQWGDARLFGLLVFQTIFAAVNIGLWIAYVIYHNRYQRQQKKLTS